MCNAGITLKLHNGLPAVINDERSYSVAKEAAVAVVGEKNVFSQRDPSLGGEDFSFYQQRIPGCMIRFGAAIEEGARPAHSSRFNFDEKVLSYGADWLAAAAVHGLKYLR
jgi:hippurate hydrolase